MSFNLLYGENKADKISPCILFFFVIFVCLCMLCVPIFYDLGSQSAQRFTKFATCFAAFITAGFVSFNLLYGEDKADKISPCILFFFVIFVCLCVLCVPIFYDLGSQSAQRLTKFATCFAAFIYACFCVPFKLWGLC